MDQRREFVLAHLRGDQTMAELCRSFRVSRKTGYKWVNRFFESGLPGLVGLSRAPVRRPHALHEAVAEAIVTLRKEHPTGGGRRSCWPRVIPWPERRDIEGIGVGSTLSSA